MAGMIPLQPFGRTGHNSTRLLFGAAALGEVSQDEADATMELIRQHEINHIDVAASYGEAELRIGPWMADHRAEYFLATKTEKRTRDEAWAEINRSLERLQTDHVDLIQLHNLVDEDEWQTAYAAGGVLEAVVRAREEGLVRAIGVTGHGLTVAAQHLRSLAEYDFDSVLLPYNYPMSQNARYIEEFEALVAACAERNVAVQTIKSITRAPWGDKEQTASTWYEPLRDQKAIDTAVALGAWPRRRVPQHRRRHHHPADGAGCRRAVHRAPRRRRHAPARGDLGAGAAVRLSRSSSGPVVAWRPPPGETGQPAPSPRRKWSTATSSAAEKVSSVTSFGGRGWRERAVGGGVAGEGRLPLCAETVYAVLALGDLRSALTSRIPMPAPVRALRRSAGLLTVLALLAGLLVATSSSRSADAATPKLTVTRVVGGLAIPWDVTWVDSLMLFDQRAGGIWSKRGSAAPHRVSLTPNPRVFANGESGMLGMVADPRAAKNKNFYTCMALATSSGKASDVQVWKWRLTSATTAVKVRTLIKGIPLTSGRHSGCRLAVPVPEQPVRRHR